jgi:hypothetical protein
VIPGSPDDGHRERLPWLSAVEASLADPVGLVRLLADAADAADAADDDAATARAAQAFGLDRRQAEAVLDVQFRRLNRAGRDRLADEVRVLRAQGRSSSTSSRVPASDRSSSR